jgi:hypothetical protein
MDGLSNWIRKLQQEVELALSEARPLPSRVRLEANRVTLTLELSPGLLPDNWPRDCPQSPSRLTIEFQVHPPEAPSSQAAPARVHPLALSPEALRELVREAGSAAFGAGGFDNSARAEVFCELVDELSAADVLLVLKLIEDGTTSAPTPALQHPVTRLGQVLGFSPVGREEAALRLRQLLTHTSVAELTAILREYWSFGTHWPQLPVPPQP